MFKHHLTKFVFSVASQTYRVAVHEEQVILGNDVLLKCNIPSFEADFVTVASWVDSEGLTFPVNKNYGKFSLDDMSMDMDTHIQK